MNRRMSISGGLISTAKLRASHSGLLDGIDRAAQLAQDEDACGRRHEPVSAWSVQLQLEHLLLADRFIVAWLHGVAKGMMATDGPARLTIPGRMVLITGFIPRGKGRAPDFTRPEGLELSTIGSGFSEVRNETVELAKCLDGLAVDPTTRRHPVLGLLTPPQWIRFAHVHHRHHDKIIGTILAAN